jgi:malic enzyme
VTTIEIQATRIMHGYKAAGSLRVTPEVFATLTTQQQELLQRDARLKQHVFLQELQERNQTLFQYVVNRNIEAMAPILYQPTVVDAARHAHYFYRRPVGMYVTARDKGDMFGVLQVRL